MKVLIAKPGLDGHDRGAKVIARALRDAGCEIIYLGIRNTPEGIARAVIDEDVDVLGLSCLSGAHLPLTRRVMSVLQQHSVTDVPVVIGGTIPFEDVEQLKELGIARVFPTGTPLDEVVRGVQSLGTATGNSG